VVPWGHVPPNVRGVPLGVGGDGELSWVPGQSHGKHARGKGLRRLQHDLAIAVSAGYCLPPAPASQRETISELNPRGLLSCCVLRTHNAIARLAVDAQAIDALITSRRLCTKPSTVAVTCQEVCHRTTQHSARLQLVQRKRRLLPRRSETGRFFLRD